MCKKLAKPEGIFAVYKPEGISSHDVVQAIRRQSGQKKVGHAGTLDPSAKGILVVGIGRKATKKLGQVAKTEKEYIAKIRLGWTSTTDDSEGHIEKLAGSKVPSQAQLSRALRSFEGTIIQKPPVFSSVKIRGRPAYKFARANKQVDIPSRKVQIKNIELLNYKWPLVLIKLVTGPGVYIRALARDLGDKLGTGGYLQELERTRVGSYTRQTVRELSEFKKLAAD